MSSFATELADRGYVAVTVDQPGHGSSDPPAFADGWGGPATLDHTRSLETVDDDRVALAGHSMGGFASLAAAEDQPDGYESIVLIGSTWGYEGAPEANETTPRNMAVLFSPYDEFAPEMWNESVPGDVTEGDKLATAFGTDPPVEHGQTYGDAEDGTARLFTAPPTVHSGMHHSTTAIGDTLAWIAYTTDGPAANPDDQRWYWATIGHLLTFVGSLVVATGTTALTWRRLTDRDRPVSSLRPSPTDGADTGLPRSTLLGLAVVAALTYYPLAIIGTVAVPVTRLTHQELTHGYIVWALGTAVLTAGIVRWRHGGVDRTTIDPSRAIALRALAAAIAGVGTLYMLVAIVTSVPGGGLRAWLLGLDSLSRYRWFSAAVYATPLTSAAVVLSVGLDRTIERRSFLSDLDRGLAVTCGGLVVFLILQYAPLFLGYGMLVPALGPLAIAALYVTGLLAVATAVSISITRLAGSPLPGGLLAGLLVTWLVVATGAIQVAPF